MAPHATSRKGAKTQKKDHNKVKIDYLLKNFMVLLTDQINTFQKPNFSDASPKIGLFNPQAVGMDSTSSKMSPTSNLGL